MAKIVCLGWGSLVWDPGCLPIKSEWFKDGPMVQVEFLRQSGDGRITLVLDEAASPVPARWSIMASEDLEVAAEELRKREKVLEKNFTRDIGQWKPGEPSPLNIAGLQDWSKTRGIDGVVWTALSYVSKNCNFRRTAEETYVYLKTLNGETLQKAETYIRCAPAQIDTPYRRIIAAELGWTPSDLNSQQD